MPVFVSAKEKQRIDQWHVKKMNWMYVLKITLCEIIINKNQISWICLIVENV